MTPLRRIAPTIVLIYLVLFLLLLGQAVSHRYDPSYVRSVDSQDPRWMP